MDRATTDVIFFCVFILPFLILLCIWQPWLLFVFGGIIFFLAVR